MSIGMDLGQEMSSAGKLSRGETVLGGRLASEYTLAGRTPLIWGVTGDMGDGDESRDCLPLVILGAEAE